MSSVTINPNIGTYNPRIDFSGNAIAGFMDISGNARNMFELGTQTGDIRLVTAGTDRLHVSNSNGYVGINNSNPQYQLDISNGTMRVSGGTSQSANYTGIIINQYSNTSTGVGQQLAFNIYQPSLDQYFYQGGIGTYRENNAGNYKSSLVLYAGNTPASTGTTSGIEGLRINSSGYVGIGTTNPAYNLDVNGAINCNGGLTTNNSNINAGTGTVSCGTLTVSSNSGNPINYFYANPTLNTSLGTNVLQVGTSNSGVSFGTFNLGWTYNSNSPWGSLGLTTASSTQLTMDSNGVCIGSYSKPQNSSTYKLEVSGSTYLNGSLTTISNGNTASNSILNIIPQGTYTSINCTNGNNTFPQSLVLCNNNSTGVCINTATPQSGYQLTVNGSVTTNNSNINTGTGTITGSTFISKSGTNQLQIYEYGDGNCFYDNNTGTQVFRCTATGPNAILSLSTTGVNIGGINTTSSNMITVPLNVTGLITANGGLTIPSGQTLTVNGTFSPSTVSPSGLITANGGIVVSGYKIINFNQNVSNCAICLYDGTGGAISNTSINFYGFGIAGNILRYQVPYSNVHVFYTNDSANATALEIARFNSSGLTLNNLAISTGTGAINCGSLSVNSNTISLGTNAGSSGQATQTIAIGTNAGQTNQKMYGIAIGNSAGINNQGTNAIGIGSNAGNSTQGIGALAVGYGAGQSSQGQYALAVGGNAGVFNQGQYALAVGNGAGFTNQGTNAIAIGINAGSASQGQTAVAIGYQAGQTNQGPTTVAIGYLAGQTNQGVNAVAIGSVAAQNSQGESAIAIGNQAGQNTQGSYAVAIGIQAGQYTQGSYTVAIGYQAGRLGQPANSIVINASGNGLNGAGTSSTCIAPLRSGTIVSSGGNTYVMLYNATTCEVGYSSASSGTSKTFVIPHPTTSTKYLVHACLEGPESGVYYRGKGEVIDNQQTTVYLPDYVDALATEFTVQITAICSHPNHIPTYGASEVTNNQFTVYGPTGKFYWLVQGKRGDIEVEPDVRTTNVHGDGPYRWI